MYGYITQEALGGNPHPPTPEVFESEVSAVNSLHKEAVDHFRFNESNLTLVLFEGQPDGDEERFGYPDFPDTTFVAEQEGNGFKISKVGC